MPFEIHPNPCFAGWAGCDDNYTGGHYCVRDGDHSGDHRCTCGSRSRDNNVAGQHT